jgi:hypothetical protein
MRSLGLHEKSVQTCQGPVRGEVEVVAVGVNRRPDVAVPEEPAHALR